MAGYPQRAMNTSSGDQFDREKKFVTEGNKPIVVGDYYGSPAEKQAFLRDIFDDTAKSYESIAKWGWFGSGDWYRQDANIFFDNVDELILE